MIHKLQVQAEVFQRIVDPIYDRFLRDVNCIPCTQSNPSQVIEAHTKEIVVKTFHQKKKRYASITLLTAGKNVSSGFSNMKHRDCDYVNSRLLSQCMYVLLAYQSFFKKTIYKNEYSYLNHIRRRFLYKNQFPLYTTCGYRIFISENNEIKHFAFFIYNDFGIAISLTSNESMYHTFDAFLVEHQTSVPISVDNGFVYFNHPSLFIFAWGNGKSEKRLWLERRGYKIAGSIVKRNDFVRYFESFSVDEQRLVNTHNWI